MPLWRRLEEWKEEEVRVKWKMPLMTIDQMSKILADMGGVPVKR